jgi:hypothetical protein
VSSRSNSARGCMPARYSMAAATAEGRRTPQGWPFGWAIAALAIVAFVVIVLVRTADRSGHCSCEPPIAFGQPGDQIVVQDQTVARPSKVGRG